MNETPNSKEGSQSDKPKITVTPAPQPKASATPATQPKASVTPAAEPKASATPAAEPKASATPAAQPKASAAPAAQPKASAAPAARSKPATTSLQKYLVELIGTFFFVLTIGCAGVLSYADKMAPLAIGSALMVMIFAGGHISGAHYNPAVSLAVMLRGKLPPRELPGYLIAQLLGGIFAAMVVAKIINGGAGIASNDVVNMMPAIASEFLFTFALVYVVLNVATARGTQGNSFYGLAIGFTVMVGAFAVGKISGGVFNPAVGAGLVVMGVMSAKTILMYFIAQFAAAFLASTVFQQTNGRD